VETTSRGARYVSLPQGFTKEFVEEVEAVLIQEPRIRGLAPSYFFAPLNTQKEEE